MHKQTEAARVCVHVRVFYVCWCERAHFLRTSLALPGGFIGAAWVLTV